MSPLADLLGPLASACLNWLGQRNLPQVEGNIILDGLSAQVEVLRDRWGVPHIYASNVLDLAFAQGFVHAQDRLWQMELNRRTGRGLLSELFGELALDTDRAIRTFGFNRLAKMDLAIFPPEARKVIEAYTAGINAFLEKAGSRLPVEFLLLRHRPRPWEPEDTVAFMRLMIWQLSHAWNDELVRAELVQAVGPERAAELEIHYPEKNPAVLPEGIQVHFRELAGQPAGDPFLRRSQGSNAWAIAGSRSDTGTPYLCNDMHLAITLPGLWYEAHLEAGDYRVTGVTLPGVPSVLVGHNDRIAWGMTLAFTDCEDLYVERFDPAVPGRYRSEEGWLEAEVIEEPIPVKGRAEPHIEKVTITRHGPVISDLVGYARNPSENGEIEHVAVSSMALRPCLALTGWLDLNRAQGWDDFVAAMSLIEAPQLNVTYADVEGNIGYWVTGKVPVRAKGDGSLPVPGWTGEYEWVDEVAFEAMPHALNPAEDFLVNCNNRIVTEDYPYYLGNIWMNGYRARRVTEMLANKTNLGLEDFCRIQMDVTCLPGLEFVDKLKALDLGSKNGEDEDLNLALEKIFSWDGRLATDSVGGTLYEVTRHILIRELLEPGLGKELTLKLMGQGFHPLLKSTQEFYGYDTVTLLRLMDNPASGWVQQAGGLEAAAAHSLKAAVAWLRAELGPDPESWQWGRLHQVPFSHALSLQKPLDQVFNRGPFSIGGNTDTPCQTSTHPATPYGNNLNSPSNRHIIDLGNFSRSLWIFPPGQSGQLGSKHYDDLIDPWLNGRYHPMLWEREEIEGELAARLVLEPR
jgi:penicillin G amidase